MQPRLWTLGTSVQKSCTSLDFVLPAPMSYSVKNSIETYMCFRFLVSVIKSSLCELLNLSPKFLLLLFKPSKFFLLLFALFFITGFTRAAANHAWTISLWAATAGIHVAFTFRTRFFSLFLQKLFEIKNFR